MAKMYPAQFYKHSEHNKGLYGERLVYEALQKMPEDWVVLYNCWRHVLISKEGREHDEHRSYETDFIILIPGCGIMVLEVKNWMQAKIENGCWYRRVSEEEQYAPVKHGSPLNQAAKAASNLCNELRKHFSWSGGKKDKLEVRCMAVMLGQIKNPQEIAQITADDYMVTHLLKTKKFRTTPRNEIHDRLYLCGTESLNTNLQERITELFCFKNNVSADELDEIRRYLLQNLEYTPDAGTAADIIERAAAPLTALLPMLEDSPGGFHIRGGAGTGKSQMLCAEAVRILLARRHADLPARILILCHNLNLAAHLRRHRSLVNIGIDHYKTEATFVADSFTHTINYIYEHEHGPRPYPLGKIEPHELAAAHAAIIEKDCYKADYIFVDEAQDFQKDWWPTIQAMLRPGGKLYIFSDSTQKLYSHDAEIPPQPVQLKLHYNLRNTSAIASFAASILPVSGASLPLPGPKVEILPPEDEFSKRAELVKATIERLQEEGFALHDIVALTPWRKKTSLKEELLHDLVDFPAENDTRANADERLQQLLSPGAPRVLGETIKAFKGLESPAVILTDISNFTTGFSQQEFYVACTRARFRLIIIPTSKGAQMLRDL